MLIKLDTTLKKKAIVLTYINDINLITLRL